FRAETRKQSGSAEAWFRLGCALRARHDSAGRKSGDFQQAIRAWTKAIELNPRNYIFRRRLQQYGPRLDKPYPFYDWIAAARRDLAARGEEAPPLRVALEGSEIARPSRGGIVEARGEKEPDPKGAIPRDAKGLVAVEAAIAPSPARAGSNAAIYLRFTPNPKRAATWDNEAGPLTVWLKTQNGFKLAKRSLAAAMPDAPSSSESRSLEFELGIPRSQEPGEGVLEGYALYYVCEGKSGTCSYLRHDFKVPVEFRAARQRRGARRR
ncbi:MAG: tetratricopeptide repeat protein, partial [Planctomycetota bacterium]